MASVWNLHVRWIDIDGDARTRATLDYRLSPRLTAGLEANPDANEVLPRATWFALLQTEKMPSVTLGVASDRLSTPEGYAGFLTFARSLKGGCVSVFGSVKLSSINRAVAYPFGANFRLGDWHVLQVINDGNYTHALLTHLADDVAITAVWARMRHFGVQLGFGF